MAPRIDTSGLFNAQVPQLRQPQFGGLDLLAVALAKRQQEQRAQDELQMEMSRQAFEQRFRQGQEQRLREREQANAYNDAQKLRNEQIEKIAAAKPEARAFTAQLYGGKLEPGKADTSGVDFTQEDESSPLGFTVTPEWERRTAEAEKKQILTMPGGQPMELPGQGGGGGYDRIRAQVALDPMHAALLRRNVDESEAAGLTEEEALRRVDQLRTFAQRDAMQDERLAAQGRRRGAGGGPKKADPRLELLDKEGNVIGTGRSPGESEASRKLLPSLVAARKAGEELKGHIGQYKNISKLNPMDWISGDVDQQAVRDQLIDRLVGARKEITGALNAEDVIRYKKQLDTAMGRGPEAVSQAIDSFVRELENMYDAKVMSARSGGGRAPAPKGNALDAEADELLKGIR